MRFDRVMRGALMAALMVSAAGSAPAQFGGLGDLMKRAGAGIKLPSLRKDPITTSLNDAKWGDPSRDGFVPPVAKQALTRLTRGPNGGFMIQPGYYGQHMQSYCLHAGTYGPGGGDGYLYAPPLGSAQQAVVTIARNSVRHPEIDQHVIQTLLWAIIARARFENLSGEQQAAAAQLLDPRQLATLNRGALDILGESVIQDNLPSGVRQVLRAEADLRSKLSSPGTSFAQLERIAVLTGAAGIGPGSIVVPSGRWNRHPDGYWVRYIPSGYSDTLVEIWVEPGSGAIGKEFDPATQIAVPGNTSRQRLLQTARPVRD